MRIRNRISAIVATVSVIAFSLFGISGSALAATGTANANGGNLQFNNTVKIGQNATVGFTTRYNTVFTGVDALVTVTAVSNSALTNIDRVSTVNNWQLWTNEQVGAGGGYTTYRVDFVASGTRDPIIMQNFNVNVGDIDARQYVQFTGPTSYTLAQATQLSVAQSGGATRFSETAGVGSTDDDTRFWAQVTYAQVSSVDVTLGAGVGGSALFQVSFGAASWGGTAAAPVAPTPQTFTVAYNCNPGALTCGGGATASTSAVSGTAQSIRANGFTPVSGYTFNEWNTRSDGSGVSYVAADTIVPTTDVTLYAIWSQSSVTISYNANGGSGAVPPIETINADGTSHLLPPYIIQDKTTTLARDGYSFVGWNTQADGLGLQYYPGEEMNVAANTQFFAVWQPLPVVPPDAPINIDLNPGDPIGGAEVDYVIPDQSYDPNSNCDPTTNPDSAWTMTVTPLEPTGTPVEIDAGCTPQDGDIYGTAVLPQDVPEGIYEIVYESTNGEQIIRYFEVGPSGTFIGQTSTDPRLAKTGTNDAFVAQFGAVLAMATGSALLLMRRKRSAA